MQRRSFASQSRRLDLIVKLGTNVQNYFTILKIKEWYRKHLKFRYLIAHGYKQFLLPTAVVPTRILINHNQQWRSTLYAVMVQQEHLLLRTKDRPWLSDCRSQWVNTLAHIGSIVGHTHRPMATHHKTSTIQ